MALGSSATDFALGGGLGSLDGDLTITGCTFTGNQALGGTSSEGIAVGGAIASEAGNVTISNSTFTGNQARGSNGVTDIAAGVAQGGAIDLPLGAPNHHRQHFHRQLRCRRQWRDRAIRRTSCREAPSISVGSLTITGSTFSGNSAVGGNGATGAFAGEAVGGAIVNVGPTSISGSEFDHNQAIGGSNGNSGPGQQFSLMDIGYGGAIANGSAP